MKIRKKLLLVFVGLASLVALIGYFTIKSLREITLDVTQIKESSILELEITNELALELVTIDNLSKEYIQLAVRNDSASAAIIKKELDDDFAAFETALDLRKKITIAGLDLYKGSELEAENAEIDEIDYLANKYKEFKKGIMETIMRYENKELLNKYKSYEDKWLERHALINYVKSFNKETQEEITGETSRVIDEAEDSTNFLLIVTVLSFVIAIMAGILISKSIVSPIAKLKVAAQSIANGDMEVIKIIRRKDEIGELTASFNKMTKDLKKTKTQLEEYNMTLEQKVIERTATHENNIKKLKLAEATLKSYANDLKNSNLELEQFAYVASHDLQEPLRTISSFADLFERQYKGRIDKKGDKYLSYIVQASDRMQVLIKDLLDYSRIGREIKLQPVDCNLIVAEVIADLGIAIEEAKAVITSNSLPVINGYATELKQLFQNLIMNAIKFKKRDLDPHILLSARLNENDWEFTCQDNGIGIEQAHRERIFIIFQRLHTRSEYEGSGIGLAHCRKIVELHDGKIWVESEPNGGSTFHFTIHNNCTDEIQSHYFHEDAFALAK